MTDPQPPPDEEVERAAALVSARMGTSFSGTRRPELLERLAGAMVRAGCSRAEDYRHLLDHDVAARDDLAGVVTVPESYFFRDPAQLDLLRREVLPDVVRRRGTARPLRLWSAGCSAGQEPYTLAMVLEEAGLGERSRIVATDVSAAALAVAELRVYPEWSLRGVGTDRRRAYFRQVGRRYEVHQRFAGRVSFRLVNLADEGSGPDGRGDVDVVLCRNVLIYLTPDGIRRVARRLAGALAPDGWLLTAPTDPSLDGVEGLQAHLGAAGVVYRRASGHGRPSIAASGPPPASVPAPPARPAAPRPPAPAAAPAGARTGEEHAALVRALGDAGRLAEARAAATEAVRQFPVDAHLRYLHAVALLEDGCPDEAVAAADAALYLRPNLAVAHLARARAAAAAGDLDGAGRSFRNARQVLAALPADAAVELADGEVAGRLAAMAETHERLAGSNRPLASRRTGP